MTYDTIIIGAGMSGLAAGIRLAHYNKKVLVLEKHAIPGGLNSHFSKDGRRFDVGLHAMTNFVERGQRSAPLTKLLRQLRIPYDELDLVEQSFSAIDFPENKIRFGNSFTMMADEVAREFPGEVDGFLRLVEHVKNYNDVSLDAAYVSAQEVVASFITSRALRDMIFCPVMYYGSAVEDDMDFSQFCIMFKSLYLEGFCRPQNGVRHLLRLLRKKLLANGAEIRMRTGVKQILRHHGKAVGVELENGEIIHSTNVLSSAGYGETLNLLNDEVPAGVAGELSFVESMLVLDKPVSELGLEETIIFFNREEEFHYRKTKTPYSCKSGVICMPGNFKYTDNVEREGMVRFTSLANYYQWKAMDADTYARTKENFVKEQINTSGFGDKIRNRVIYTDAFTPLTVKKFTSHINGAIYGSPVKVKSGFLGTENLYLCGTDQGFLGIVGALLSGISISNKYLLL
ncbi:NAD(P)/FAD-dependent oxidoreductase [Lentisphaera profundi]|uniref:NAD(P)/FAD-dependent oxidoreductase n=1 Tax=Lentisphaera profundi TaxID=1658616 RepID=A0ABY7VP11_9BACT|nr:NAD(P)/FAD-dependent oxidoreductase [Lentisphaera profundi]WDE95880.1 NAD(P)/FAD-dependent oxidoreductase [Lentisphaera profundi]